jgi:hypothetical protein
MKNNIKISLFLVITTLFTLNSIAQQSICSASEPSVKMAKTWWEDQTNVWTPIGWKDNYLRYTVLYNGALIIDPAHGLMGPRPNSRSFIGKDFMLTFHAAASGLPAPLPEKSVNVRSLDRGYGIQGWDFSHETPLLWTEFRAQEGVIIRAEVFSHQKGSSDVVTGLEPLYAWVRLKVVFVDPIRRPEVYPVTVQMSRVYYEHNDECYNIVSTEPSFAIMVNPDKAPYEQELKAEPYIDNGLQGLYITEPDGKVRLAVQPTDEGRLKFFQVSEGVYALKTMLKAEVGDYVDLLLPMFPEERDFIAEEQVMTYDGALTASDWYWSRKPSTAATFKVPEKYISEAIGSSIKFAPVIAEFDHVTKEYSYLTGAWGYDCLWSTPTSMISHMLVDQFGYHDFTTRYSEIFMKNQGTVKAPGKAYYLHPGYYGSPKTLTSIDWLSDHGAILLQVSTSGLLSGNREFIEHWMPSIVAACDFIKDMSSITDHDGVKGLLPPAVATDEMIETQSVWSIAWNYKGLVTAVKLMKSIGHPRAQEFDDFANQTKTIFQQIYREQAENGERWIDAQGRERYRPPTTLSKEKLGHAFSESFYLDGGPMVLVWAGLMDANDPIMKDVVDFFRYGPNTRYYTPVYNSIWRPSLQHEMSTCEPCYSWNVFYNWRLGDRYRFLEGMYSLFVGAMSQNTYISCEHRHGIQGNLFVAPLAVNLAKLAVIDDQISEGEVHLLRLCPQAWISSDEESIIENLPTEYGRVDLKFYKSKDGKTLNVTFNPIWRDKVPKVILHPVPGIEKVIVNNKTYDGVREIVL